jgi:uncharacterized protein (DUF1015 family)
MITISPVKRALIPVDSKAAQRIMGPNYDEFQSDEEIWNILQSQPDCILRVTMAHCDQKQKSDIIKDGSPAALEKALTNFKQLVDGPLTRVVENMLWVYEIRDRRRPELRQIGLGGAAKTKEIRTEQTPNGSVIRNEGIREEKAQGRANLIEKTHSYIGCVNNTIEDASGTIALALEQFADAKASDYEATDEFGNQHRVWLVTKPDDIHKFTALFAAEPCAFVADGNHRSAAAALLGKEDYLAVFFTTGRMWLAPYNRLVKPKKTISDWPAALATSFEVEPLGDLPEFQPTATHEIGFYLPSNWYRLRPKAGTFDPKNAAQAIDSDIVQNRLFNDIFGIADPRDEQLTFVGGNKSSAWLKAQVDQGKHEFAVTLPPVTMQQFVEVCKQNRFMPPKSTWFEPKIRSGLVTALLD